MTRSTKEQKNAQQKDQEDPELVEIALVGDLTDREDDLTERILGVDQGGEEYCNKVDEPPKEVSKRIETPRTGLKNLAIPAHVDHGGCLVSVGGLTFDLTVEENQRLSKDVRSAISRFFWIRFRQSSDFSMIAEMFAIKNRFCLCLLC